jgi:hypothetical protein
MSQASLSLKSGLLVLMVCVALTAQTTEHKQSGVVLFTNGESKPFATLGCAVGYGGMEPCDVNLMRTDRYSENLDEILKDFPAKTERMAEWSWKGLKRIDFIPLSQDEKAKFDAGYPSCGKDATNCPIRKVSVTFGNGRPKRANVFVYMRFLSAALGPENQRYDLGDYDIAAVVVEK